MLYNNNATVCKMNFLFSSFHSFYSRGYKDQIFLFLFRQKENANQEKTEEMWDFVTLKDDFVKVKK
jgi:hypothetical protein